MRTASLCKCFPVFLRVQFCSFSNLVKQFKVHSLLSRMCPFTWGIVGLCTSFLLVLKHNHRLSVYNRTGLSVTGLWLEASRDLIKLKLRQQAGPLLFWSPWGRINFLFIQVVSRIQFLAVVALRILLCSGIPCFQKTPAFLGSCCPPPCFLHFQSQQQRVK